MAGEGTSNIGDVVATLRADLRDFVNNIQAARTSLDGLTTSGAANERVVNMVSKAIDNWTILLARGKVTNEQFAAGIQKLQASFGGALAPVQQAEKAVSSFGIGGQTGSRGLYLVDRQLGYLAATALSARGQLGSLAAGMLIFGGGTQLTLGILGAAALIAVAYERWTEKTRQVKKEHDALLKTLDDEAKRSIPAVIQAQTKLTVAQEAYTDAITAQSDANKVLQKFAGPTSFGGIQLKGPLQLNGQPTDAEMKAFTELLQAQADIYKASGIALKEYVDNLSKAITLQVASSDELRGIIDLEAGLAKATHDSTKSIEDRVKAQEELNAVLAAFRERAKGFSDFMAAQGLDTKAVAALRAEQKLLDDQVKSGNLPWAIRVQLMERMAQIAKTLGPENLGALTDPTRNGASAAEQAAMVNATQNPLYGSGLLNTGSGGATNAGPSPLSDMKVKMTAAMRQMREIVARGVHDIIVTFVDGILGGQGSIAAALINMFKKAFEQLIAALIEQKILNKIFKALNLVPGGGGGGGSDFAGAAVGTVIGGPAGTLVGGFAGGLLGSVAQAPVVNISVPAPPLPSPAIAARDTYWRSVIAETGRVVGFQLA